MPNLDGRSPLSVSVVIPVYAGEKYLEALIKNIESIRLEWAAKGYPIMLIETILIDDCAKDGSPELIDRLARKFPWVIALHLGRNSGQHAATMAGILYTTGDWVVTLDEDLQHPPERIVELLRRVSETGCDVVYARPTGRIHSAFRDLSSRTYKRIVCWLANNPHASAFNSFRLMRGEVARAAASVCSYDTYFDVALLWFTQHCQAVDMDLHDERFQQSKSSGYNLKALFSHARKLLFSSQLKILRLGAGIGIASVLASGCLGLYLVLEKLLNPAAFPALGWTSLILAVMFFGGMSLLILGLLLEYMSILVRRALGRPLYFVVDRSSDAILRAHFQAIG